MDKLGQLPRKLTTFDLKRLSLVRNKFDATTDPTSSDDTSKGYSVGSSWINTSTDEAFICVDDTVSGSIWIGSTSEQHSELGGLLADNHTQYHLTDGSRPITGPIITTGGGARGTNAIDLQLTRDLDSEVAYGNNSSILGGQRNTISGTSSNNCRDASVVSGYWNLIYEASGAFIGTGSRNKITTNPTINFPSDFSFIGAGAANEIWDCERSVIVGGQDNIVRNLDDGSNCYMHFIGAGEGNIIEFVGDNSSESTGDAIVGGYKNKISSAYDYGVSGYGESSFIGAGKQNEITASGIPGTYRTGYHVICGGQSNSINGSSSGGWNYIGGGSQNNINNSTNSSIVGGNGNSITGEDCGVLGCYNTIVGDWNYIVAEDVSINGEDCGAFGGYSNSILSGSTTTVVVGGSNNSIGDTAACDGSAIFAGERNDIDGLSHKSVIVGGDYNVITAGAQDSTIVGGSNNTISDSSGYNSNSILGGYGSTITNGDVAVIVGGDTSSMTTSTYAGIFSGSTHTIINSDTSVILGGYQNNMYDAHNSVVLGGENNNLTGTNFSTVTGKGATLSGTADRVFADVYGNTAVTITVPNAHIIYGDVGYEKKVGIQTLAPQETLDVYGNILISDDFGTGKTLTVSGAGSRMVFYPKKGTLLAGRVHTTYSDVWDDVNIGNYSIAIGENIRIGTGQHNVVMGRDNAVSDNSSENLIIGGSVNSGSGSHATILGGGNHTATGSSTCVGGYTNNCDGNYSIIAGGRDHNITSIYSSILGGTTHTLTGIYSSAVGGADHIISGDYSVILGGYTNTLSAGGDYSIILGGSSNTGDNTHELIWGDGNSTVGATDGYNVLFGQNSVITVGGWNAILGGWDNSAGSAYGGDVVCGGYSNEASGGTSFIGGGESNIARGRESVVTGGKSNVIDETSDASAILGGEANYISGGAHMAACGAGYGNSITADMAMTLGGQSNTISGEYAIASGYRTTVAATYGVLFGRYGNLNATAARSSGFIYGNTTQNVTLPDVHIIYGAAGYEKKVGIQTLSPRRSLDVLDTTNPQVRLTHTDNLVYTDLQTTASGNLVIAPTGPNVDLSGKILTNYILGGNNYNATIDPVVTDDSSLGYSVGSTWINVVTDEAFLCVDSTISGASWIGSTAESHSELNGLGVDDHTQYHLTDGSRPITGSIVSSGGNARGLNATDLQTSRTPDTEVASGAYSVIGGGRNNTAEASDSTVAGGRLNYAKSAYSAICGGTTNTAGYASFVGAGTDNSVNANNGGWSAIVGGQDNIISGNTRQSFIGAGSNNSITTTGNSYDNGILSGKGNYMSDVGDGNVIGGGETNYILPFNYGWNAILGGWDNSAGSAYGGDVVCGGYSNEASGGVSFVGGGEANIAGSQYSAILGGKTNIIDDPSDYSAILGGEANYISGGAQLAACGAGYGNSITANMAMTLGGQQNSISGEYGITSGYRTTVASENGVLFGRYGNLTATAIRSSGFIYGNTTQNVTLPDVHIIYGADGYEQKVGIQTLSPNTTLDVKGGLSLPTRTITVLGNTSITINDYTVRCDATLGNQTLDLPTASSAYNSTDGTGLIINIKKVDVTTNKVTIDGSTTELVEFDLTQELTIRGESLSFQSNGNSWDII